MHLKHKSITHKCILNINQYCIRPLGLLTIFNVSDTVDIFKDQKLRPKQKRLSTKQTTKEQRMFLMTCNEWSIYNILNSNANAYHLIIYKVYNVPIRAGPFVQWHSLEVGYF